jgi:hypothetical protein
MTRDNDSGGDDDDEDDDDDDDEDDDSSAFTSWCVVGKVWRDGWSHSV